MRRRYNIAVIDIQKFLQIEANMDDRFFEVDTASVDVSYESDDTFTLDIHDSSLACTLFLSEGGLLDLAYKIKNAVEVMQEMRGEK